MMNLKIVENAGSSFVVRVIIAVDIVVIQQDGNLIIVKIVRNSASFVKEQHAIIVTLIYPFFLVLFVTTNCYITNGA